MSSEATLAIVGVGLIGGSLGQAWRAAGFTVLGVDEPAVTEKALAKGAIDRAVTLPEAVGEADVIVLATPVRVIIGLAGEIGPQLRPGQIVTDVGSTKEAVVAAWEGALAGTGAHFIGGHPMFGREVSSINHADRALVHGVRYILTPTAATPPSVTSIMKALAETVGAEAVVMAPDEHDRRVASVSHLPQVVATALAAAAGELEEKQAGTIALAGGGFRDTTRIAASPADIWTDVLLTNQPAVLSAIQRFREALDALEEAIEWKDPEAIQEIFARAHAARKRLP